LTLQNRKEKATTTTSKKTAILEFSKS